MRPFPDMDVDALLARACTPADADQFMEAAAAVAFTDARQATLWGELGADASCSSDLDNTAFQEI